MLVLLPPSEGKAASVPGPALDPPGLSLPELNPVRERVLDALVTLCEGDEDKALEVLGLGPRLRDEVARNAALRVAGTIAARELYTGVLYDALGLGTLDPAAAARAERSLLVFSGLWGVLRPGDRVPPYRCPVGARLPGLGALAALWRGPLGSALPALCAEGLVLDLRSSAYAPMWRPAGAVAARTATVRVLHERIVDGRPRRTVVSHFNKATKGRIVRALLSSGADPAGPAEFAQVLRDLGWTVEASVPARAGTPWSVDVVVTEV